MKATTETQSKTVHGRTIVHLAAELGHDLMLYFFGEMGLDIDATDSNGDTPLHLAIANNKSNSVRFLLSLNAELNERNLKMQTPLHVAVINGNIGAAKELLVKGANRNAKDSEQLKPIDLNAKVNSGQVREEFKQILGKSCYSGCPLGRLPYMPIERNNRTMLLFVFLFAYILIT